VQRLQQDRLDAKIYHHLSGFRSGTAVSKAQIPGVRQIILSACSGKDSWIRTLSLDQTSGISSFR